MDSEQPTTQTQSEPRTIVRFESGPTTSGLLTWYHAVLDCGHSATAGPHPWVPPTMSIGETLDCVECANEKQQYAWLQALDPGIVFRSRFRITVGRPSYFFYRRDKQSPSGVMLIGSVGATQAIDELLAAKGISPLSPTEGLGSQCYD
jgi:hypothetical protein